MAADDRQAARFLRERWGDEPFDLAIVCGTGFGHLADAGEASGAVLFSELPGWPTAQIAGHSGRLVAATCFGWRVLVFQGRFHLYQALTAWQVATPVRLANELGCQRLLLTNAAGGINRRFRPGDLMFIKDHINLLCDNPLRNLSDPFVDLSRLYRKELFEPLAARAQLRDMVLHDGVLAALPGPSFETPAEIDWLERIGADAVSMSTVPEAIMAAYLEMEVVGLSLIANPAAGRSPAPLNHEDVLAIGVAARPQVTSLVHDLITHWKKSPEGIFSPLKKNHNTL